jgi:hypothetical protein
MMMEERFVGCFDPDRLSTLSWKPCQSIDHSTDDDAGLPRKAMTYEW